MKTLIVDDELVSRQKMKKIMQHFGECIAVENGPAAVSAFKEAHHQQQPFNLITLDISMPEMDGTEVLQRIRNIEKAEMLSGDEAVKIIMVTSQSDKDTVINCVRSGCNSYIAKPFNRETVSDKLSEIGLLTERPPTIEEQRRAMIQDLINRFQSGEISPPSLPQITVKLREMIKSGTNQQQIAELIGQDAAITSKIIAVSNTSYYRGVDKNHSLEQAIGRLGQDKTLEIVEFISAHSLYTVSHKQYGEIMQQLWQHSLRCAYAAQITCNELQLELESNVFMMGLLHNIGKLILLQLVAELDKQLKPENDDDGLELFYVLTSYHRQIGATLLKRWDLPQIYSRMCRDYNRLEELKDIPVEFLVVNFANLLCELMEGQDQLDIDDAISTRKLRIDPTTIARIRASLDRCIDELNSVLN